MPLSPFRLPTQFYGLIGVVLSDEHVSVSMKCDRFFSLSGRFAAKANSVCLHPSNNRVHSISLFVQTQKQCTPPQRVCDRWAIVWLPECCSGNSFALCIWHFVMQQCIPKIRIPIKHVIAIANYYDSFDAPQISKSGDHFSALIRMDHVWTMYRMMRKYISISRIESYIRPKFILRPHVIIIISINSSMKKKRRKKNILNWIRAGASATIHT